MYSDVLSIQKVLYGIVASQPFETSTIISNELDTNSLIQEIVSKENGVKVLSLDNSWN